jgi:hypothetical protein
MKGERIIPYFTDNWKSFLDGRFVQGVQRGRSLLGQYLPNDRQLPMLGFPGRRRIDSSHTGRASASGEATTVDPQQVAQETGVAAVGFPFRPTVGLGNDDLAAAIFLEHVSQPWVHAANLDDRHEPVFSFSPLGQILEKHPNLLPSRADLPLEDHVAVLGAKIHGNLAFVLVDTKV